MCNTFAKISILLILLVLPGCATLTVAAVGGAVALGAAGAITRYEVSKALDRWDSMRTEERRFYCYKYRKQLMRKREAWKYCGNYWT